MLFLKLRDKFTKICPMTEKFSLIIPTMWYAPQIKSMIGQYIDADLIAQIIIINNNAAQTPAYIKRMQSSKLLLIDPGKNIFVNPAWNLGAAHANHTIILANDDIIINKLLELLQLLAASPYDLVGASVNNKLISSKALSPLKNGSPFPRRSFGCFMMVRNYTYIPEQMLVYSGDVMLYKMAKKPAIIKGDYIFTPISTTIRKRPDLHQAGQNDAKHLQQLLQPDDENQLNIIIRTSGRPNYFKNCIQSIRQHAPQAMLHISVDNPEDLNYVTHHCQGMRYNYYIINKLTVATHCKKIKIWRKPFIYNHYFNIIKPFIKGYVLHLDDDDQLLMTPASGFHQSVFYLYKVDIAGRIVPDEKHWQTITLNNISGLSVLFHSSVMQQWLPQRGGDYDFISALKLQAQPIWINSILSATQTGGNNGRRNDLQSINTN